MTDKKIILAVDSSSSPLLVALETGGKAFSARNSNIKQEEYLFTLIKKLFAKSGHEFKETNSVFFIKGPGRFTGIRIGITLASMLRELNGAKIASATVFDAVKYQVLKSGQLKNWQKQNPDGKLAVIIHAFREEYFISIDEKPLWTSAEGVNEILNKSGKLFLAGWAKEREPLNTVFTGPFTYADDKLNFIQPKTMLEMALEAKYKSGDVLEPLYLKPARFELGR